MLYKKQALNFAVFSYITLSLHSFYVLLLDGIQNPYTIIAKENTHIL